MEKSLLIIDDDPQVVEIFCEILQDTFDRIFTSFNVEDAISKLKKNSFSLIILDINLQGKNEAEVICSLRTIPENTNNQTPVIISSASINIQFIERNYSRFAGIIMKPFELVELLKMVESILKFSALESKVTPEINSEIPYLACSLPFPIPQLEFNVNKKLEQIRKNPKLNQLFSQLKIDRSEGNLSSVRIGLLINVATGIAGKLEWYTDKTLEKFIYAAYLHDMALASNQEFIKISNSEKLKKMKSKLTEMEIKQILGHPNMAADMIEEYKEISSDVVSIVRQHHECPDGSGFPGKITYQKITPLSSVFIVAHDLTEYIMDNTDWTLEKYLQSVKFKFKGVHFNKILSTIRTS